MMKTRTLALIAALSATVLSGCSNGKFAYATALGDISRVTGITTGFEPKEPEKPEAPALPPGAPLIVGFEAIRVALPFAGDSGTSKTYTSPDGVSMAMTSDYVTRATGLGIDLNGMYLPANSPLFGDLSTAAGAQASTDRVMEYWEKERLTRAKFRCTLSSAPREGGGSVVDELCKRFFEDERFTNRYWLTADGKIECSRQKIHPKLSPLQFFSTEQQALTLDLTKQGC